MDKRRGKVLGLVCTSQDERCTFSSVTAGDGLERSHGCVADWILTINAYMAGYRWRPELGRVHKRVDFAAGPALEVDKRGSVGLPSDGIDVLNDTNFR
jgi:hypothetical protein